LNCLVIQKLNFSEEELAYDVVILKIK